MADSKLFRIRRRDALRGLAGAGVGSAVSSRPAAAADPAPTRSLTDPDMLNPVVPWKRVLTAEERKTLSALCDVILPADERSPSASQVGVPDFIDEWVSAPYPLQEADRQLVRGGLSWLNTEASKRFRKPFAALALTEKHEICDDICAVNRAKPQHRVGALFFDRVRKLCLGGFYTTEAGMKDLGYVGNTPMATFEGPPPEVLKRLKLGQS